MIGDSIKKRPSGHNRFPQQIFYFLLCYRRSSTRGALFCLSRFAGSPLDPGDGRPSSEATGGYSGGAVGPTAHRRPAPQAGRHPPSLTECRARRRADDLLLRRPSYSSPPTLPVRWGSVLRLLACRVLCSTRTGCEPATAKLGGVCPRPLRVSSELDHASTGVSLINFGIFRA